MTLILNEIHVINGLNDTISIAAADSRLTDMKGRASTARKIHPLPNYNGAVSFFGLAEFELGKKKYSISQFLRKFIQDNYRIPTLSEFAKKLRTDLNAFVPSNLLMHQVSGFHISGFENGIPDFWYICNYGRMTGFEYEDLRGRYHRLTSDFLGRDAKKELNWDGKNMEAINQGVIYYRNGDYRGHAVASRLIDKVLAGMFMFPDFKKPKSLNDYAEYLKFKLEFIAYLYRRWNRRSIIGTPIRVVVSDGKKQIVI